MDHVGMNEIPVFGWKGKQPALEGAAAKFCEDARGVMRRLPGKAAQHPCPVPQGVFGN